MSRGSLDVHPEPHLQQLCPSSSGRGGALSPILGEWQCTDPPWRILLVSVRLLKSSIRREMGGNVGEGGNPTPVPSLQGVSSHQALCSG